MSVDANSVFGNDEPPSFSYNRNHTESYNNQYRPARIQQGGSGAELLQFSQSKKESFPSSPFPQVSTSSITSQHLSHPSSDRAIVALNPAPDGLFVDTQSRVRGAVVEQVNPLRLAGHLSVLVVAAIIFVFAQMDLSSLDIASLETITTDSELSGATLSARNTVGGLIDSSPDAALAASPASLLRRAVMPFTTILPDAPTTNVEVVPAKIRTYTVQSGDTVLGIANRFGLKPETLQWSNGNIEKNPDLLSIGDTLRILPQDGAIHRVRSGDTLSKIATSYNVTVDTLMGYAPNGLAEASTPISIGQELIIPGGIKAYVPPQSLSYTEIASAEATVGIGEFGWPTLGRVTQGFWSGHRAVDIGAYAGAAVKAADAGRVVIAKSGWNYGYGNYVVVDHGNGFVSLYGHLNSIFVQPGENVYSGQKLGSVGNTGNSTGPHLHFEIRYKDALRNPFTYLN